MGKFAVVCVIFAAMSVFPFVSALLYYRKSDGVPLFINQQRARDPRFFVHSFRKLIKKGIAEADGQHIMMKTRERYIDGDLTRIYDDKVEYMIISKEEDFSLPDNVSELKREMYLQRSASLDGDLKVKAICCDDNLELRGKMIVERWLDAEGRLDVYGESDLGISVTSGEQLCIHSDCSFKRLYAPVVRTWPELGRIEEETVFPCEEEDIISRDNVIIESGTLVKGSVKSHGKIIVRSGAQVLGNIFAEKDITVEDGVKVRGNLFSQESIFLNDGVSIGSEDEIRSVIARENISIKGSVVIYGRVRCEGSGSISY